MVMVVQNGVPMSAFIMEILIGIIMFISFILVFKKWVERRTRATLFVSLSVLSWSIASLISGYGKYRMFYAGDDPRNWAAMTIIVAYVFTCLASIFIIEVVVLIFHQESRNFSIFMTTANAITIGFLIPNISFREGAYRLILPYLIWHIIVSLTLYTYIFIIGRRESKNVDQIIPKAGFRNISRMALSIDVMFVLFVIDLVYGIIYSGYSVFYYAGWLSGGLGSIFAILGYGMPSFYKKMIERKYA